MKERTVGIIGTGSVGAAAAYALFNQRLANEIILVDKDEDRARGEAMDLMHGQMLVGNISVKAGDYESLSHAEIIIISAGVSQSSSGDSRLGLLNKNIDIFREIIEKLDHHAPDAIIIIATNPVDILTYATQKLSKRTARRILGTGTLLDTARFRSLLGRQYGVDPQSVHAYILGEHGDSEVPIWSQATIGGKSIKDQEVLGQSLDKETMNRIFEETKNAAYEIIDLKGHTDTAIGVVIARIVQTIFRDTNSVIPISVDAEGAYDIDDVCLSVPACIGAAGMISHVLPDITDEEAEQLRKSGAVLRDKIDKLDI